MTFAEIRQALASGTFLLGRVRGRPVRAIRERREGILVRFLDREGGAAYVAPRDIIRPRPEENAS